MNKKSFAIIMFGCVLLFSTHFGLAQTSNPLSLVSVKANKFVTSDGKPIVFRGLDASDPDKLSKDGHWDKSYFEAIKSWGANVVRFPVHPVPWRTRGKENYLKLLDEGIQWATD